jgi:hypothetical protein
MLRWGPRIDLSRPANGPNTFCWGGFAHGWGLSNVRQKFIETIIIF